MSGEIIQIIVCNNYDGFQHLSFIFSQTFFFQYLKDYLMMKLTLRSVLRYGISISKMGCWESLEKL